jgi:hypothetical protein
MTVDATREGKTKRIVTLPARPEPIRVAAEETAVVGRLGDPGTLPEKLQARETPSGRKPVGEFAFKGGWPS